MIPKGLRDKYKLSPGTKVFFEETTAGIILKQVDAAFIQNAKGVIPAKKEQKPMPEWWPALKAAERMIEEGRLNILSEPEAAYRKAVKIKRLRSGHFIKLPVKYGK